MVEYVIYDGIIIGRIIFQYVKVRRMTLYVISTGNYSNIVVHFEYFLGCIVCISNGSQNVICSIITHLICILCNSCPCQCPLRRNKMYLFIHYLCPAASQRRQSAARRLCDDVTISISFLSIVYPTICKPWGEARNYLTTFNSTSHIICANIKTPVE